VTALFTLLPTPRSPSSDRAARETVGAGLRRAIQVVEGRDIRQDFRGVRQLVDIAPDGS
jgi:microcompartment protein CcmK/EutM